MSNSYLFNDDARVKRADKNIYLLFFSMSLIIAVICTFFAFKFFIYGNLNHLQKHYFGQFAKSAIAESIGIFKTGRYTLIVRNVTEKKNAPPQAILCSENQMMFETDVEGNLKYQKNGIPLVHLKKGVPVDENGFNVLQKKLSNQVVYNQLSNVIFENYDFRDYLYLPFSAGSLSFLAVFIGFAGVRTSRNQKKMQGKFVRGTSLVTVSDYAKRMKKADGFGLEVRERIL